MTELKSNKTFFLTFVKARNSAEITTLCTLVHFCLRSELTRVNSEPKVFDHERLFVDEFTRYVNEYSLSSGILRTLNSSWVQVDFLVYIDGPSHPVSA